MNINNTQSISMALIALFAVFSFAALMLTVKAYREDQYHVYRQINKLKKHLDKPDLHLNEPA
jgi:hypothetical protein